MIKDRAETLSSEVCTRHEAELHRLKAHRGRHPLVADCRSARVVENSVNAEHLIVRVRARGSPGNESAVLRRFAHRAMLRSKVWLLLDRCLLMALFLTPASVLLAQAVPELSEARGLPELLAKAESGDADAQYEIAVLYSGSETGTRQYAQAAKWFSMAAKQGNGDALRKLGFLYLKRQNSAEAVKCFREAAHRGDATSQLLMGSLNVLGREVLQNYAEAIIWFRMAAAQGVATALYNLGTLYHDRHNHAEAVRHFRAAAEQGLPLAQFNLGLRYAEGRLVPRDDVRAYMWISLAVARSRSERRDKYVEGRELLITRMTPEQIAEAQQLAGEWTPRTCEVECEALGSWGDQGVPPERN